MRARYEYDGFIGRWERKSEPSMTYPVLMALAGAHLESALDQIMFRGEQTGGYREEDRTIIRDHTQAVYNYVGNAAQEARAAGITGPDKEKFQCAAREKLFAARALEGMALRDAAEIDEAIRGYTEFNTCIPGADRAIRYLTGVRKNIGGSLTSSDQIAKTVSSFINVAPKGKLISPVIDMGYEFYKKYRPGAREVLPR